VSLDHDQFESLLQQALEQAEQAAARNEPERYREAFLATFQAMRLLARESGAWREMVARATEEYEGDEGI
jgi:hypothetical protein